MLLEHGIKCDKVNIYRGHYRHCCLYWEGRTTPSAKLSWWDYEPTREWPIDSSTEFKNVLDYYGCVKLWSCGSTCTGMAWRRVLPRWKIHSCCWCPLARSRLFVDELEVETLSPAELQLHHRRLLKSDRNTISSLLPWTSDRLNPVSTSIGDIDLAVLSKTTTCTCPNVL